MSEIDNTFFKLFLIFQKDVDQDLCKLFLRTKIFENFRMDPKQQYLFKFNRKIYSQYVNQINFILKYSFLILGNYPKP